MADNLTTTTTVSTIPSGTVISTDDAGAAGHVQRVKLAIATDGSSTHIGADADGLQVQGAAADGATLAGNPVLIAGSDGTNAQNISVDANGNVQVDLVTANVTNAGTFAVQEDGAALTALQLIDDTVYSEDAITPATIAGNAIVMERDDALATVTPVEGDWIALRGSAEGALWVQEFNSDAILADTASMDTNLGTVAGAVSGSEMQVDLVAITPDLMLGTDFSTVLGTASLILATQADNVVNTSDGLQTTSFGYYFDGTTWDRVRGDATDGMLVNLGSNNDVTITGTVTVDLSTNNDVTIDGSTVVKAEDAGHTTGDTGIMALAVQQTADAALAGTTGDYAPLQVDETGYLKVNIKAGSGSGTEYTEDAAGVANPAGPTTTFVRADTPAALTTADGDVVALRGSDYGASYATILDGSGNIISSFGGSGGTSHADDAAFSIGSASSITPTGYLADDTTSDSVDEGDVGVPRMTLTRKPYAVITDATSENNAGVDGSGHLQVDIAADSVGIGGGTQYTLGTDTYTEATSIGTIAGAVRNDTLAALANTDNEIAPLQVDANGALYVLESNSAAILADTANMDTNLGTVAGAVAGSEMQVDIVADGAGLATAANQSTMITALQLIDDVVYTDDTSTHATGTSKGALFMAAATPTDTSVEANDIGAVAMSTDRRLHVDADITAQSLANLQVQSNSANLATQTTVAAIQTAVEIMDDWDETNRAAVNLISGQAGVAAGAGAVGATVQRMTLASDDPAVTALQIMDDWDNAASDGASVSGDVAHDSPDAGEPVKLGFKAIAHGSNPTDVAANDRTDWYANRAGIPWVIGGHPNIITKHLQVTDTDGAQTDTALVTVAASNKIVVTHITVTADNANTGDVQCRIGFGTASTPAVDTDAILAHSGIAAGSGVSVGDGSGIIAIGADNEDLRVTCEDPAGGNLDIVVGYYTIGS